MDPEQFLTNNPALIIGGVFALVAALTLLGYYLGSVRPARRRRRILEQGRPAEATILEVRDSGWRELGSVVLDVDLEVRLPGEPPYRATARHYWRRTSKFYQGFPVPPPGSVVRVMVDPANPRRVELADEPALGAQPLGGVINFGGSKVGSVTMGSVASGSIYVINGTSYSSPDEMPPEARAVYDKAQGALGDADKDGLPDIFAGAFAEAAAGPGALARLRELKAMLDQGLITAEEYAAKKAEILRRM